MSLKALVASMDRGELVLPALREHLLKEIDRGVSHGEIVRDDARMTIDCFRYRLKAYNHDKQAELKKGPDLFHPSQLSACQRKLWYDHHKAPRTEQLSGAAMLKTHMTFELGTYAHVIIQNLCERAGILVRREVAIVDHKLRIIGHADGHLRIKGEDILLEFKTTNSRSFTLRTVADDGHVRQAHGYMKSLGLKKASILYLNKDTSEMKEFVVPYDEGYYQKYVATRISQHFANLKKLDPPGREGSSPSGMPCMYCPFTEVCFETRLGDEFLGKLRRTKKVAPLRLKPVTEL